MGNAYFQKKIKELRKDKNLTMDELAAKMNITKSRVNMWENNGTVPRQDILIKLSQYFNISTDDLLGNFNQSENPTLRTLQRNLKKLDAKQLEKANAAMQLLFEEVWEE